MTSATYNLARSDYRQRQGGVALVVVLWFIVLLSILATALSREVQVQTRINRNLMDGITARYLAEVGIHRAILKLLQDGATREWMRANESYAVDQIGVVRIRMLNVSGKIDINVASAALLDGLLRQFIENDKRRQTLVDAIIDWRDLDQLRRPHGAEDTEYRQEGLPYEAKDAPFVAIEELRLVLSMDNDIFRRIAPFITIYSRSGRINPRVAPREVLLALPGVNRKQVMAYITVRATVNGDDAELSSTPKLFIQARMSQVYRIAATAQLESGIRNSLWAIVRISGDPRAPYSVLEWHEN